MLLTIYAKQDCCPTIPLSQRGLFWTKFPKNTYSSSKTGCFQIPIPPKRFSKTGCRFHKLRSNIYVRAKGQNWVVLSVTDATLQQSSPGAMWRNSHEVKAFHTQSINQVNQTSIAPISPAKPRSVARQLNQCSTAKSRKQIWPWGMTVSMGERPSQRDVSSDIS